MFRQPFPAPALDDDDDDDIAAQDHCALGAGWI